MSHCAIKWILTLLLVCLGGTAARAEKNLAFIFGTGKYDNLPVLPRPISDARAVAGSLLRLGYKTTIVEDATRQQFAEKWQNFLEDIAPGDTVVFFAASHGVSVDGRNYLIPSDYPRISSASSERIGREALGVDGLLADIRNRRPRVTVAILDACRDDPFRTSGARGSLSLGSGGLSAIQAPAGTFIMYSAAEGSPAYEDLANGDNDPNSVFVRLLLPLMEVKGLPIYTLARQLRNDVAQLTRLTGSSQIPAFYDNVLNDFCLAGCDGGAAPAVIASVAPVISPAAQEWVDVQDSRYLPVLEAFKEKYASDKVYAELASGRIVEVKREQLYRRRGTEAVSQAPSVSRGPRNLAFVIGIGTYKNIPDKSLPRALTDANAISAALTDVGFEAATQVDLTYSEFSRTWGEFVNQIRRGDTVTVFFSGHGIQIDGLNYLLPADVPKPNLGRQEQLKRNSMSLSEMLAEVRTRAPRIAIMIVDACRDNPFDVQGKNLLDARGLAGISLTADAAEKTGQAPKAQAVGQFIMFAAGEGEKALEKLEAPPGSPDPAKFDTDPYSLYTRKLIPLLKTKGIRIHDLARQIREDVSELALTMGHSQNPAYYDGIKGSYCFAGCQ